MLERSRRRYHVGLLDSSESLVIAMQPHRVSPLGKGPDFFAHGLRDTSMSGCARKFRGNALDKRADTVVSYTGCFGVRRRIEYGKGSVNTKRV